MNLKVFKTLDEQIELLIKRGVTIDDYDFTREMLLRENFFFVNGYRHLFLKNKDVNDFCEGTTFSEIYALFYFDRQLRNILFKHILIFENNLKSVISYTISKNHGYKEKNYLNTKIFIKNSDKRGQVNDLIKKVKRQITVNGRHHSATDHYLNKYGYVPLWIAVKVLSFGTVGEFFIVLQPQDQREIAEIFTVDVSNLILYLPMLANYRNLCAHEDICFENRTQKSIDDTVYHNNLSIPKIDGEFAYGKNDLFALVIMLKGVLSTDNFKLLIDEIDYELNRLSGRLDSIGINKVMERMGFPVNYKEIIRME